MRKLALIIILLLFLLPSLKTGVLAQQVELPSPGLTPDSPFYFLDTLGEKLGMFFTFRAEKKFEKALKYAEEKLAEVKIMAEKNKAKALEKASQKYQEFLVLANQKTQEIKEKGRDIEELATLITEKTLKHQEILVEVFEKVSEQAKETIQKAIEVSRKGSEEAVKAVSGAKKEELLEKIEEVKIRMEEVEEIADWETYINEKYGYSFKYPPDCFYGPMPVYCKEKPPEERPPECLCFLNGENPDSVFLQAFTGEKDNLALADFVVFHSIFVDSYSPPIGIDLVSWLKENFPYQDIPDEINTEIDGIPAVKVYTPFSGMAYSQEDIYFIKSDKLFRIGMLDVDNEDNKKLYNQILSTFKFVELEEMVAIPNVPGMLDIDVSVIAGSPYEIGWTTVSEAAAYELERDINSSFSNPITVYFGPSNSFSETLLLSVSTTYYFRVKACNSYGCSSWSKLTSLWVEVPKVEEKPYIKVISPNGGEEWIVGNTYDITWTSKAIEKIDIFLLGCRTKECPIEPGISSYKIYPYSINAKTGKYSWTIYSKDIGIGFGFGISEYACFKIKIKEAFSEPMGILDNFLAMLNYLRNTLGVLSVQTSDLVEDVSDECFTIIEEKPVVPNTPTMRDIDVSVMAGVSYKIGWTTISGATTYILERDTNVSFSNPVTVYSGQLNSFSGTFSPSVSTTYYFRVKACNSYGCSSWSKLTLLWVEVCSLPESPVLANLGAPVESGTVYIISWVSAPEFEGVPSEVLQYTLQRDTNLTFSNPTIIYRGSLDSVKDSPLPQETTTYFYRVKAENVCGDSPWSNIKGIQVEVSTLLEIPVLTDPGVSVNLGEYFILDWTSIKGAKRYWLQRDTSSYFPSSIPPHYSEVNSIKEILSPEVSTTYYYRVKACSDSECSSYSNVVDMRVIVPSITVTSPNGGEGWTAGQTYDIRWESEGIQDNVEIYLRDDRAGPSYKLIATELSPSLRKYSWMISSDITSWIGGSGHTFKIQVRELGGKAGGGPGEGVFDESDNYFSIVQPSITVTFPNGGEEWVEGKTYNIKWSSTGLDKVTIDLFAYNSEGQAIKGFQHFIAESIDATRGYYNWTIPDIENYANYKLRIYNKLCIGGDADLLAECLKDHYFDESDNYFSIVQPSITVISPNGGEEFTQGADYTITWESTGIIDNVGITICMTLESYEQSRQIEDRCSEMVTVPNIGSYSDSFGIAAEIGNYTVKIEDVSDPSVYDESDNYFSIISVEP